ncbi:MAG: hypothetical protein ACREMB_14140 [Candidatus Rokuibacteriota bacterium]
MAGYLVRCPLGGYAWQTAHYLLGLRALGHDVWFYEDTGHYTPAYNPMTGEHGAAYDYGTAAVAEFLGRVGCGDRWVFVDVHAGREYGPGAGRAAALLREADLLVNLSGVNRIPPERRGGRPAAYIDLDPGYTQLGLANGDTALKAILDEHAQLFTLGENIGTARSPIPTSGYTWHPTRQPIVIGFWADAGPPGPAYTTVGKWSSDDRRVTYRGQAYGWSKRAEWERYLDLPVRAGATFELAMNVGGDDLDRLDAHAWRVVDPIGVSADPWCYRDYVRRSRGEFTVAKDMNVRLRSGWFSDRGACYLAAGRPVVMQDTGYGDVLPLGAGLHAVSSVDEAAEAIRAIEGDYARASAHASEVARECFAADQVLGRLLGTLGW